MSTTVQQLLETKRNRDAYAAQEASAVVGGARIAVLACRPGDTVREVARVMSTSRVGALLVLDGEAIAGIVSERDVMMRVVAQGRDPGTTPVSEVMTRSVITASPDTGIEQVEDLMREKRIRHVPVVGTRGLLGVISIGDVMAYHAEARRQMVEQLTEYVTGGPVANIR